MLAQSIYNHITHEAQANPLESQASQGYIVRPSQKEKDREWLLKPRDTDSQPLYICMYMHVSTHEHSLTYPLPCSLSRYIYKTEQN